MGVLARLRAWWRRRPWSRGDAGGASDDGGTPGAGYECAVCGTGVDDPDGPCPLCQGTDVVPATGDGTDGADEGGDAVARPAAGDRREVTAADDASVERLRTLREDGDLLERYADRWRPVDGGFRVETTDGTREVDSREEVVALLRAADD